MSEKVNGLDDRPLGISMAISYQRKGELSLWHDCLLRLFPKPLKWDFWSNVHATTSTPSEEPIDKVRSSQSEQPREVHINTDTRIRHSTASSIYSCDEDGKPLSRCRKVWDGESFIITIFDNGFKDFTVDNTSPCDSTFITALPPMSESLSLSSSLNVVDNAVTDEEDDGLFQVPLSLRDGKFSNPCRTPIALAMMQDVSDSERPPVSEVDISQLSIDRGKPLPRSSNQRRSEGASKAKAARAKLTNIQTNHLYVTADGSPLRSEVSASTAPLSILTTRADASTATSTPMTFVTCRTSKAELVSTPPPDFPIREALECPSSGKDHDPFTQSIDTAPHSGHTMAAVAEGPDLSSQCVGKGDNVVTEAGALAQVNLKSGFPKRVSTPGAHPALPLSKYNQHKVTHPILPSDIRTPAQNIHPQDPIPYTGDQAGLEPVTNLKDSDSILVYKPQLAKPLPALPSPSAAASAAMDQAHIHPAQRVYTGFLTSPTEGMAIEESNEEKGSTSYLPVVRVEDVEDTKAVDDNSEQNRHNLNNSWVTSQKQRARRRYPPRSSSLDATQHFDVQACPGTPGSVGSHNDHENTQFLSLNSILLEGPPRVSKVAREEIREEFRRGHDTFLTSNKHRHHLRNLLPTAFSLPLASKASTSSSSHHTPNSASSAPAAPMQVSSVTNKPIPGLLVPPHNQHVSHRPRDKQKGMSFPQKKTAGAVAVAAVAALKKKGSLANMLMPSSPAPFSPRAGNTKDREGIGKKGTAMKTLSRHERPL